MIVWTDTYSYVACFYGPDGDQPGDCYTRVGYSYQIDVESIDVDEGYETEAEARAAALAAVTQVWWVDDGGGDDTERSDPEGPFDSEEEARQAAKDAADDANEAEDGEDADAMLERVLRERAGDPDPDGEYCVWWETVGDDSHVVARYATEDAATAAAELAQLGLEAQHPAGVLLCGYDTRMLVDGEWVAPYDTD